VVGLLDALDIAVPGDDGDDGDAWWDRRER